MLLQIVNVEILWQPTRLPEGTEPGVVFLHLDRTRIQWLQAILLFH